MRAWQFLNPYPLSLKQQLRAWITQQPSVPCTEFGDVGEFLSQMYVSEAKWIGFSAGVRPQQEGWSRGTVGAEDSEDFHVLDSPAHIT